MNDAERLYHKQINDERLEWKRLYYEKEHGKEATRQMLEIEKDLQKRHHIGRLAGKHD